MSIKIGIYIGSTRLLYKSMSIPVNNANFVLYSNINIQSNTTINGYIYTNGYEINVEDGYEINIVPYNDVSENIVLNNDLLLTNEIFEIQGFIDIGIFMVSIDDNSTLEVIP